MAGAAKACAGHGQNALLKQGVYKSHVVAAGRFGEEVKGPGRHLEFIASLAEHFAHGLAAGGVDRKVYLAAQGGGHDVLADHWRVDEAEDAVGEGKARHELGFFFLGQLGRNRGVAQAFARQGEALGKGTDGHGVGVEGQHRRHFHSVIGQKAVGLVRHQPDGLAEFLALVEQKVGDGRHFLALVDDARGIVGRIDEHHAGFFIDGGLKGVQVWSEGVLDAGHCLEHAAVVGDVEAVFHKVRGKGEHFFAGVEHGAQKGVEHACRAAAENDVFRRYMRALLLAQVGGQLFARPGVAAVGHVAKGERFTRMLGKGGQALGHSGRSGQVGVAEAEVIDLVRAITGLKLSPGFEHAAYPGCVFKIAGNAVGKNRHKRLPVLLYST